MNSSANGSAFVACVDGEQHTLAIFVDGGPNCARIDGTSYADSKFLKGSNFHSWATDETDPGFYMIAAAQEILGGEVVGLEGHCG